MCLREGLCCLVLLFIQAASSKKYVWHPRYGEKALMDHTDIPLLLTRHLTPDGNTYMKQGSKHNQESNTNIMTIKNLGKAHSQPEPKIPLETDSTNECHATYEENEPSGHTPTDRSSEDNPLEHRSSEDNPLEHRSSDDNPLEHRSFKSAAIERDRNKHRDCFCAKHRHLSTASEKPRQIERPKFRALSVNSSQTPPSLPVDANISSKESSEELPPQKGKHNLGHFTKLNVKKNSRFHTHSESGVDKNTVKDDNVERLAPPPFLFVTPKHFQQFYGSHPLFLPASLKCGMDGKHCEKLHDFEVYDSKKHSSGLDSLYLMTGFIPSALLVVPNEHKEGRLNKWVFGGKTGSFKSLGEKSVGNKAGATFDASDPNLELFMKKCIRVSGIENCKQYLRKMGYIYRPV